MLLGISQPRDQKARLVIVLTSIVPQGKRSFSKIANKLAAGVFCFFVFCFVLFVFLLLLERINDCSREISDDLTMIFGGGGGGWEI